MDIHQALVALDGIREVTGDAETAHSREDMLRMEILKTIAEFQWSIDKPNMMVADAMLVSVLARLALSSDMIKFPRWCA